MLFVHFPCQNPLLPVTVVLPLSSPAPASLTALATPTSLIPTSGLDAPPLGATPASMTSPQNAMDDLVATLVVGMPEAGPSPSVVAGALGLGAKGEMTMGAGTDALEEELKKAELSKQGGEFGMEVIKAAVGITRSLLSEWYCCGGG